MFGSIIHFAAAILEADQKEKRAFKKLYDSLPSDMAAELRRERKNHKDRILRHYKNLEIAREGRSLNFWGNR